MQKGMSLVLSKELDLEYQPAIGKDFEKERRTEQDLAANSVLSKELDSEYRKAFSTDSLKAKSMVSLREIYLQRDLHLVNRYNSHTT